MIAVYTNTMLTSNTESARMSMQDSEAWNRVTTHNYTVTILGRAICL